MQPPSWYTRPVSRETSERLDQYARLLRQWTDKINLVSKSTLPDLEERHIWDSAQIYEGQSGHWVDIGSGGGLPGVVVAILAAGEGDRTQVTLVESDQRKCAFLRTCIRELDLSTTLYDTRIEAVNPLSADILSARALAPLNDLIGHAYRHLNSNGTCIFMKGAAWKSEIPAAEAHWRFSYDARPSNTNPEAAILRIRDIERV